jgi:NAD(P)-dependent dehydrogenase (short-subunit alcohol dehydrogenase family)
MGQRHGQLGGKVAVVIGGHSGFGEAITHAFAAEGAHVVVAARRAELVERVAASVDGLGVQCDITDDEQVQSMVRAAVGWRGRVDVAVNCAGFEQSTPLADLTPDRLEAMHAVQLTGALYCMRHLCNAIASHGEGGSFVSLSSQTAHSPSIGMIAYASAKAAIEYATKIAAVEYGPRGVRCNAIAAALIETPMTARIFTIEPVIQAVRELTPLGRMGSVHDIANAALFLCSEAGSYITGQTVCVDGGASLLALPTPQIFADVTRRWQEARAGTG